MSGNLAGQRIRELREMHKYTREALAEKVRISDKFLYEIETGRKGFSAEVLCRLSDALSVSCDYIMMGDNACQGMEKELCVLKMADPRQRSRMQDILRILSELCAEL